MSATAAGGDEKGHGGRTLASVYGSCTSISKCSAGSAANSFSMRCPGDRDGEAGGQAVVGPTAHLGNVVSHSLRHAGAQIFEQLAEQRSNVLIRARHGRRESEGGCLDLAGLRRVAITQNFHHECRGLPEPTSAHCSSSPAGARPKPHAPHPGLCRPAGRRASRVALLR